MLFKNENLEEKIEHDLFDVSIVLKGLHAVVEIISGFFALLISPDFILKVLTKLTAEELSEDPTDKFTKYIIHLAQGFSVSTKEFLAFYLLSHGVINLVLVVGLWKKKMWAYHSSFVALTLFAAYQLYRYLYTHSVWLLILTIFDFVVIWLIFKEYRRLKTNI